MPLKFHFQVARAKKKKKFVIKFNLFTGKIKKKKNERKSDDEALKQTNRPFYVATLRFIQFQMSPFKRPEP